MQIGAAIGIAGVCLMLLTGTVRVNPLGVAASVSAMTLSSLGYILAKRWSGEVDVLAATSWQLIAGGVLLIPPAVVVEGTPPSLNGGMMLGFSYVIVVATAIAFVAWFTGLRHLPAGTVGLIGLLNPVTGVLLGTLLATDTLTLRQICGVMLVLTGLLLGQPLTARLRPASRCRTRAIADVSGPVDIRSDGPPPERAP